MTEPETGPVLGERIRVRDEPVPWTIDPTPNGAWFQRGDTAVLQSDQSPTLLFVPNVVLRALVEQARAEGAEGARRSCGCMNCEDASVKLGLVDDEHPPADFDG